MKRGGGDRGGGVTEEGGGSGSGLIKNNEVAGAAVNLGGEQASCYITVSYQHLIHDR